MTDRRTPDSPKTSPSADEIQRGLFDDGEQSTETEPVTETKPKLARKAMILAAAPDALEDWDYAEPKPTVAPEDILEGDETMESLLKGYDASIKDRVADILAGLKDAVEKNAPCRETREGRVIIGRLFRLQKVEKLPKSILDELRLRINTHNKRFKGYKELVEAPDDDSIDEDDPSESPEAELYTDWQMESGNDDKNR